MSRPPDPKFLLRGDMDENVHSLLFSINSNVEHLYAGDGKGTVHIWDLKTNRIKYQLSDGCSPCFNLHITNKTDLIVQRRHGIIDVYKMNESNWIIDKSINYEYCSFCRSQLLPENDAVLIPLDCSIVGTLSLKTFKVESILDPSKLPYSNKLGTVMAMKSLMDVNGFVLVAYEGGQLLLWDMRKNDVLSSLTVEQYPMTFDFDASLMQGILGSASEKLEIFEMLPNHTLSHKCTRPLEHVNGISVLSIRPDKKIVTAGCWDGRMMLFSWKKLRPLAILKEHRASVYDIVYSQCKVEAYDTKCLMAATGKDGYISMWDIYNN
ncbi:PREDICTED: guanine nucleotide-binding protein subunit beta-like protein 1 [Trachymyrmex cornetzi]|uniref:Guanine nucleotide-binding protein subunit beta-like protein 1 n=1 Tax=Trachymyrmex cornetzi TaxID=471704 RepID=A0A151J8P7_9HYME|nr:PREDICTED: guanine nucleotide-binding protein subunit beta-like protein 1 [Trachymyrmex cornetzi]XP_018361302.1 PREDICTED: guanine nucleotide-binding protein subunit beta-like protein 1 [Trachymyrmex cornetzi]KYN21218.1 Guanine nucleotide-binding protein subunit beta-like protein 1 [Trachymyrmex cornetzi]